MPNDGETNSPTQKHAGGQRVGLVPRLALGLIMLLLAAAAVGWALMLVRVGQPDPTVIAVSIFDNETGDPQFDHLVAGLSDLVVTRLTSMDAEHVAVIGNASVLRQPRNIRNLKAIADSVKADYILLGQLQRADTGYRFITHFIRLSDLTHLKANRLQMPDGNVSGLEVAVVEEFDRAVRQYILSPAS